MPENTNGGSVDVGSGLPMRRHDRRRAGAIPEHDRAGAARRQQRARVRAAAFPRAPVDVVAAGRASRAPHRREPPGSRGARRSPARDRASSRSISCIGMRWMTPNRCETSARIASMTSVNATSAEPDARLQRALLAGGRDHLRRRRFAGGERRRQRIAARQRRRHRQRRRRALRRLALEAAQDHALDRRIEIADQRRGSRDRPRLVQLDQLVERRRPRRRACR